VGRADQPPLARACREAPSPEAADPAGLLDLAEDRFDDDRASPKQSFTALGGEGLRHRQAQSGMRVTALAGRGSAATGLRGDEELGATLGSVADRLRAPVAGVGDDSIGSLKPAMATFATAAAIIGPSWVASAASWVSSAATISPSAATTAWPL